MKVRILCGLSAAAAACGCAARPVAAPELEGHGVPQDESAARPAASADEQRDAASPRGVERDEEQEPAPQSAEPAELTLERALSLAAGHRPEIAAAQARVEAAAGRLRTSGRFPNPALYTIAESIPLDVDDFDTGQFLVGVVQPLPLSGRRGRAEEVGQRELEATAHEARAVALGVRREVQSAFATALYAARAAELAAELVTIAERDLSLVRARLELGDAIPADAAALELDLVRAGAERRRARSLEARARNGLATAIGVSESPAGTLAGDLGLALDLPALEAVLASLDQNPTLLAAGARTRAAAARVELARARRIPDLRLDLAYRRLQLFQQDTLDVGLGIDLPIFDSGAAAVETSRAELVEALAGERNSRRRAEAELREAHLGVSRTLEELRFHDEEVLPRAEKLLATARARYEAGDVGLEELLPARRAWIETRLAALETRRELMSAWAQLAPYLADIGPEE